MTPHVPEPMLAGRLIYLSAAMPESEEEAANAEEAILSLARAVYAEHGQLLVNEEEDLVTLVALVAGEYITVEPEEEREEQVWGPPGEGAPQVARPQAPLIVLPRRAQVPDSEELHLLVRFGYLRRSDPEERITLLGRAAAMVCIGRQDNADWHDFARSSERWRPVVALRTTGAVAPEGFENGFEEVLRPVEERFSAWMEERRRMEGAELPETLQAQWAEYEEPILPATSYPVLMQLLVERLQKR